MQTLVGALSVVPAPGFDGARFLNFFGLQEFGEPALPFLHRRPLRMRAQIQIPQFSSRDGRAI